MAAGTGQTLGSARGAVREPASLGASPGFHAVHGATPAARRQPASKARAPAYRTDSGPRRPKRSQVAAAAAYDGAVEDDDYLEVGPAGASLDELITLVELQQGLLTAVATGGPQMKTVDWVYKERRQRTRRGLRDLGVADPFPWTGLWEWYGVWGTFGGYAGRRQHIESLAAPVLDELRERRDATGLADWGEGTIERLERRLDGLRTTFETASTLDDYQDVGRRAREILIDLGQIAFDESMLAEGQPVPGRGDAKARLDIVFERRFAGSANEEMRRFMKAAVALANSVTHSGDTAAVHAFAVAQATLLLIRVVGNLEPPIRTRSACPKTSGEDPRTTGSDPRGGSRGA